MRATITDRQVEVLRWISSFTEAKGYPPTLREIGLGLGIRSTNGVGDHLRALESRGCITTEALRSRAIVITETGAALVRGERPEVTYRPRCCPRCGTQLHRTQQLCPECRTKVDEEKRVAALVPRGEDGAPRSRAIEAALTELEQSCARLRGLLEAGGRA